MPSKGSQPEQTEAGERKGRDSGKSPEMEGQSESVALGDTERAHVMHVPWQAAATPGIWEKDGRITTDYVV